MDAAVWGSMSWLDRAAFRIDRWLADWFESRQLEGMMQ